MRHGWFAGVLGLVIACGGGSSTPPDSGPPADAPGVDAVTRPTVDVLTGLDTPGGLAVDATHLFFTLAGGQVARAPLGGGAVDVLATSQRSPGCLTLIADDLYWVNTGTHAADFLDGSIRRSARSGGGDVELVTSYFPTDLAIDAGTSTLYWSEGDGERIRAIKLDGTAQQTVDASNYFKTSIALTPTTLVWSQSGPGPDVVAMDRVSGTQTTLSSDEYAADSVVAIGDDVFWSSHYSLDGDGAIRVSRAGAPAVELIADEHYVLGLTTDGTTLYWSTSDGRIRRASPAGGSPETFIEERGQLGGVAFDATFIYWTEPERGAIVRAVK